MKSGSLWNYYRDQINDDANENNNDDYCLNHEMVKISKPFEYKTKII